MNNAMIGLLALAGSIALSATGASAQGPSEADRQLMLQNLSQADANGDGALSRHEFEVLINLNAEDNLGRAARIARTGRFDTAFARIDANGDGMLTQPELQAMVQ